MEYPPELAQRLLEAPDVVREDDDVLLLDDVRGRLARPLAAHGRRGRGPQGRRRRGHVHRWGAEGATGGVRLVRGATLGGKREQCV